MTIRTLLAVWVVAIATAASAQPTWRFHLAFEDGIGARDTIWMVYDTTATTGSDFNPQVDYALGEGAVAMDTTAFNVWTWNWDGDSTKTHAFPYSWFPILDGTIIDAMNWTPPMTISWDTAMFHAPYLPYEQGSIGVASMGGSYFFFHSNDFTENGYNMLIDDQAFVDTDTDYLFPFGLNFEAGSPLQLYEYKKEPTLLIYPNPASDQLSLIGTDLKAAYVITDQCGRIVKRATSTQLQQSRPVDISELVPGIYLLSIQPLNTPSYHVKFQKVE